MTYVFDTTTQRLKDIFARHSAIKVSDQTWELLFELASENKITVLDFIAEMLIQVVPYTQEIEARFAAIEEDEASRQMVLDARIDQEIEDFVYHQGVDADMEVKLST